MFTSRAEYRTLLRQDNADLRLTPKGHALGLATEERLRKMQEKERKSNAFIDFFKNTSFSPEAINPILQEVSSAPVKQADKMYKVFSRPNVTMDHMLQLEEVANYVEAHALGKEVMEQAEIQVKYSGYITKERNNADKLQRLENIKIPQGFDYSKLKSLSYEAREKLRAIRPVTISQASRISGVSPSDISVLLVFMGR
jgi:tRNA uridine 5-carboxymethylaminomethyl modification enzyme